MQGLSSGHKMSDIVDKWVELMRSALTSPNHFNFSEIFDMVLAGWGKEKGMPIIKIVAKAVRKQDYDNLLTPERIEMMEKGYNVLEHEWGIVNHPAVTVW